MLEASYGIVVVTPPAAEPVTVAEAKAHCRVDISADDPLIGSLITAARNYCERVTERAFVTQTLRLSMDCFPSWQIRLPRSPLQSITGVTYYDVNGTLTTMPTADYVVNADADPGVIQPRPWGYWPWPQGWRSGAVSITYVAGYGGAAAVPQPVKQAMLLLIGHWYENREAVVTGATPVTVQFAVDSLLSPYWCGRY